MDSQESISIATSGSVGTSGKTSNKKENEINKLVEFQIRPPLNEKFKSMLVKDIIRTILAEELTGKVYNAEECEQWLKSVVTAVYNAVKELGFPRYKIIVQCVLGEHRGSGVKIGTRCLWDADTDNYASDSFFNVINRHKLDLVIDG